MVLSTFAPAAACVLGLSGLAGAVTPPLPVVPASMLQLTTHETSGRTATASLTCLPTGGSHPKRDAACGTLIAADGDFARIKPRLQRCTMIYSPVEVSAVGTWAGRPVSFHTTYANKCSADAQSAGVFAL
ncbi:SSI family serine proteinase inhibitor [Amycolatopsis sp. PS_44_ISF1]|uniref:SSI family serine proteinase inhibitor n=1 Tax=Amycolatopsis sp. PS_44_ISF1 TaxID=2974917 RepID=UPI0028DF7BB7|nr:SSI family serine proteinase inhibitor [Amycolatopsis sp. PS_44_ISF1]MDT8914610.1 subtilase-type protease inhibitor [Amycolatopsis sp. PS_44_ISF1]